LRWSQRGASSMHYPPFFIKVKLSDVIEKSAGKK
jgi:hypothetical protein